MKSPELEMGQQQAVPYADPETVMKYFGIQWNLWRIQGRLAY